MCNVCYAYFMNFLYPLIAILSESVAQAIDKANFSRNRITTQLLMRLVFIGMSISLFVYILVIDKPLPHFSLIALGLMLLIILLSFLGNALDYLSLKADDISLREPLIDFGPIVAGLFGYLLFPEERRPGFLIAFALSAVIVYFGTHRRRLRKVEKKGMVYLLGAVLLHATLPSIYKYTLPYIGPEYVAFFRSFGILILIYIFMPVHKAKRKKKKSRHVGQVSFGLISSVVYALGAVASLYAIQSLGVVVSMLFLLLAPVITYLAGYFVLKEKVRGGEVMSSIALVIIIAASFSLD